MASNLWYFMYYVYERFYWMEINVFIKGNINIQITENGKQTFILWGYAF